MNKQSQFVTLVFNTNPEEKTFVREFEVKLNILFNNPDGFYVKQIGCSSTVEVKLVKQDDGSLVNPGAGTISYPVNYSGLDIYTIYTNLVNTHIGCITSGTTVCPNTYFKLNGLNNLNDTFKFRIDDIYAPSKTSDEVFVVLLEFVKF